MLINAERDAIETLNPRHRLTKLSLLEPGPSQLSDDTPLKYLGVSRRWVGDTQGTVLAFSIASAEEAVPIPDSDIEDARTCEYAVLLREPTAEELAEWRKSSLRPEVSPGTFELLLPLSHWARGRNVFVRTALAVTWAQLTIT